MMSSKKKIENNNVKLKNEYKIQEIPLKNRNNKICLCFR